MTRAQRRSLWRTTQLGLLLTLIVMLADFGGLLEPLERYFYDLRARHCQYFTPPPTDRIVHLDIDDQSIAQIGRWPWSRSVIANLIDEISRAGAKVIALDILYGQPEKPELTRSASGTLVEIDHDRMLADAIARAHNVLVPVSVSFADETPIDPVVRDMITLLTENLELEQAELERLLTERGTVGANVKSLVAENFLSATEEATFRRLEREMGGHPVSLEELQPRLLPRAYAADQRSNARLLLEKAYPVVASVLRVREFGQARATDRALPLLRGAPKEATIPTISAAAAFGGFVDFLPTADGTVRYVPLAADYRGRILPHMALATACAVLGADPRNLQLNPDQIVIPLPDGGKITIPVVTRASAQYGASGMLMTIPWFGLRDWATMYDFPRCSEAVQHEPVSNIWKIREFDDDIAKNNAAARDALAFFFELRGPGELKDFLARWPSMGGADRERVIHEVLNDEDFKQYLKVYESSKPEELGQDGQKFLASYHAVRKIPETNASLRQRQAETRIALRQRFQGRAVLIGWTATGGIDAYPTSLHPQCPGVIIQSTIINGILTKHLWRTLPWWNTAAVTTLIGGLATIIVSLLPPWRALLLTLLLTGGYLAVNGILVFDYGDRILGVAAPVTAAGLVWGGLTLARSISEAAERSRITKRFRSYVDPALVDYVIEHPEVRLDGQEKEMTVVFTDLAGFTTLSEALREKTVPLLNEYMGLMVPIIHANRGLRNKFLGDGIMFFFSAPRDNPRHARDAVATVLQMQDSMKRFNEGLAARGLPPVSMRAGISSGKMVVGDAGSLDDRFRANDYTVLGDVVNLGARLESANKATGTKMLLNDRARDLIDLEEFLVRPIGKLQVVGKTEGVMTFEPLCRRKEATEEQLKLAEMTTRVVDLFRDGQFQACMDAAIEMQLTFGEGKLARLYIELCNQYLVEPPTNGWDGQIVLFEK